MKSYVDPALPMVGKADVVAPATPQPVQLAFEFRTNGKANAAATSQMRPRMVTVASETGLFSTISGDPVAGASVSNKGTAALSAATQAAAPDEGRRLYDYFVAQARQTHPVVATGQFAADMQVHLVNDGPVTIPLRIAPAVA